MTNPKPNALPVECWHLDWQGRRASGSWGGTYVWPPEWASTSSPSRSRTTCVCVWGGGRITVLKARRSVRVPGRLNPGHLP